MAEVQNEFCCRLLGKLQLNSSEVRLRNDTDNFFLVCFRHDLSNAMQRKGGTMIEVRRAYRDGE